MSASYGPLPFRAPPRIAGLPLAARMMLGSTKSQVGWLVLAFGSFMFWLFAWNADLSARLFKNGRTERTWGQVLGCRDTGFSVGGTAQNGRLAPLMICGVPSCMAARETRPLRF